LPRSGEVGVGPVSAARVIISWSHSGRCRHEAAFAQPAGAAPVPANSGQTQNRRGLSRGGDHQINRALHAIVLTRINHYPETRGYLARHLYRLLESINLIGPGRDDNRALLTEVAKDRAGVDLTLQPTNGLHCSFIWSVVPR
jgi:hypothetical protein